MVHRSVRRVVVAAALVIAPHVSAFAQPTPGQTTAGSAVKPLPFIAPIFNDNMVLQRGNPDTIWGWSEPGDTVRVDIGDHTATATAGADKRWQVKIDPPASEGPYTVKITGHQTGVA